jgi:hypothetical protein
MTTKKKTRARDYNPRHVLHRTKDRRKRKVVFGPNWSPPSRRPARRVRIFNQSLNLDAQEMIQFALTPDFTFQMALLSEDEQHAILKQALDMLHLTDRGYSRSIVPVRYDDDSIGWACLWPTKPVVLGQALAMPDSINWMSWRNG